MASSSRIPRRARTSAVAVCNASIASWRRRVASATATARSACVTGLTPSLLRLALKDGAEFLVGFLANLSSFIVQPAPVFGFAVFV